MTTWLARALAVLVGLVVLGFATSADAHGFATSQVRLRLDGARIDGEWEIQLRDARQALGLDPNVPGEAGWSELVARKDALPEYLAARFAIESEGRSCPLEVTGLERQPAHDLVLARIVASCASPPERLRIRCDSFFETQPSHRAYFSLEDARVTNIGVFRDDVRSVALEVHQLHVWSTFVEFVREGAIHIASGTDHMLFLLALLLPAPLLPARRGGSAAGGLYPTTREVFKVVTAFTFAHSVTLCLSYFGVVAPRGRWVEVAIAVSVAAAAWNNLRPFLPGRAWAIALAFGLVHGLGFAGALKNLSLPNHARGLALAAFNVGVEMGQLAIVLALLPVLCFVARRAWYPRLVMGVGSFVIVWMAALWTIERALGFSILT
jgi:hypothetical protein